MKKPTQKQKRRRRLSVIAVLVAVILALGFTFCVAIDWGKGIDHLYPAQNQVRAEIPENFP